MHSHAGVYSDTWNFTDSTGNYNNASGTVTDTINKANATFDVIGYTGVYDGTAHGATGAASGVGSDGILPGLDLTGRSYLLLHELLHLGSTFTNVPGGTANWTFEGNDNYNSATGSVAIVITKANATFDVIGYTGVYDGQAHGATGTASGVNSEDLSYLLHLGSTFTNVPGGTATWTFEGNDNYNSATGTVDITITKANATLDVTGYTGVYDGQAHGATGTASGFHLGSTFTNVPGGTATWTFGATITTTATGTVDITITKANATFDVIGYTGVYDCAAHRTPGCSGVGSDGILTGLDLTGTAHTNAGTYTDTWTFTDVTGNYNNASGTVVDAIAKANATFDVIGYTGVYDGAAHGHRHCFRSRLRWHP